MPANRPIVPGARQRFDTDEIASEHSINKKLFMATSSYPCAADDSSERNNAELYPNGSILFDYVENRFAGSYSERYLPWQALSRSGTLTPCPELSGPDGPRTDQPAYPVPYASTFAEAKRDMTAFIPLHSGSSKGLKPGLVRRSAGRAVVPWGPFPLAMPFPNGEISAVAAI